MTTAPLGSPSRTRARAGFTLSELLVAIAIIAILSAVLVPAFAASKTAGKRGIELSNLRQIGLAMMLYAADHGDRLPCSSQSVQANTWVDALQPYVVTRLLRRSPFDRSPAWDDPSRPRLTSYGLNSYFDAFFEPYYGVALSEVASPSGTILVAPLAVRRKGTDFLIRGDHFMPMYWGTPPKCKHELFNDWQWDPVDREPRTLMIRQAFGRAHYLFADGHARALRFDQTWRQVPGFSPTVDAYDPLRESP